MNDIQTFWVGFNAVEIRKLCYIRCYRMNIMTLNVIELRSNLALFWAWNILLELSSLHTIFKNCFVRCSMAMDQILFWCIARCSSMSQLSASGVLQCIISQYIALHNLPSRSIMHSYTAFCFTCYAPGIYWLQIQDVWCRYHWIGGWCNCLSPQIQLLTPPGDSVAIAFAAVCVL